MALTDAASLCVFPTPVINLREHKKGFSLQLNNASKLSFMALILGAELCLEKPVILLLSIFSSRIKCSYQAPTVFND